MRARFFGTVVVNQYLPSSPREIHSASLGRKGEKRASGAEAHISSDRQRHD
jgi:hypothetical protein